MAFGAFELLAAVVVMLVALYYYMTSTADFWLRLGIPFIPPTPFIGSSKDYIFSKEFRGKVGQSFYNYAKENGYKYVGVFLGRRPVLIVSDVDLIKTMLVKDFQYVTDRGLLFDRHKEPLSANLFNIGNPEWKTLRTKLSPTFTSGKMKAMFYLVRECSAELDKYLLSCVENGGQVEMAEIMAKFSTDVIGSCAFGVEANSLKDPNAEFRKMGRKVFETSRKRAILRVVAETMPPIRRLIPLPLIEPEVSKFFTNSFNENCAFREQNKIVRNDFIDLLLNIKNSGGDAAGIDESILPAQAFVFFLAGFETSSGATSACLMHLAQHPEVQERLRNEVDAVLAKHGGTLNYDALQEMTYMEQVLEETMRLFPAISLLPRVVTKDYMLPDAKKPLPAGTRILIPVYGLHYDPEFYPDPERFDPERFSEENKRNRPHFAYLPFGEGPRICIGMRFAWMQMKTALTMILRSYRVSPNALSVYPMKFEPKSFVSRVHGGINIQLSKR